MTQKELIIDFPLYKKFEITGENYDIVFNSIFGKTTVDIFCPLCDEMSIFSPTDNAPKKNVTSARTANQASRTVTVDKRSSEWLVK